MRKILFILPFVLFSCSMKDVSDNLNTSNRESHLSSPSSDLTPFSSKINATVAGDLPNKERDWGEAWFFHEDRSLELRFWPGSTQDKFLQDPDYIVNSWQGIKEAGFSSIDAFLTLYYIPGERPPWKKYAYVFSGDSYAMISYIYGNNASYLEIPAKKIVEGWPSLKAAGFDRVDAVLPMDDGIIYIFLCDQYVKIRLSSSGEDELVFGPAPIAAHWQTLKKVGFDRVDAFLRAKDTSDEPGAFDGYVFLENYYIRMKFNQNSDIEKLIQWPSLIRDGWPLLESR